ncbi:MAG: cupin domain-containing protein [Dehalococcoidia bacterium]|nr:cupin domain-containing protein [Dehalococcoidia bacterium]MDH4291043.1 cupin domain-containing protein [Dehalococcoidia bacterium]
MKNDKSKRRTSARPGPAKSSAARHDDLLTDAADLARMEAVKEGKESLGDRIRRVREMRGLTIKDLSSRTGIDIDALGRIESSKLIPALGQLVRLGKALDMKMGYFISPGIDKPMTVVRKHERRTVSRYGEVRSVLYGYSYESLAPDKANRLMEPFIVTLVPTETEESSTHAGQEFLYVLEGEIKVQVRDRVDFLKAGDAVYYDSGQPHLVRCAGTTAAKILAVLYAGSA